MLVCLPLRSPALLPAGPWEPAQTPGDGQPDKRAGVSPGGLAPLLGTNQSLMNFLGTQTGVGEG